MSIKEIDRVAILDRLIKKEITTKEAAPMMQITERHTRRIKARYHKSGARSLTHKLRGRKGNRKVNPKKIKQAIEIVQEKYPDFGPTFAHEQVIRVRENKFFSRDSSPGDDKGRYLETQKEKESEATPTQREKKLRGRVDTG